MAEVAFDEVDKVYDNGVQAVFDLTLLAAGAVIVATPVVIVYVLLQRHFIRGMLTGAVKA